MLDTSKVNIEVAKDLNGATVWVGDVQRLFGIINGRLMCTAKTTKRRLDTKEFGAILKMVRDKLDNKDADFTKIKCEFASHEECVFLYRDWRVILLCGQPLSHEVTMDDLRVRAEDDRLIRDQPLRVIAPNEWLELKKRTLAIMRDQRTRMVRERREEYLRPHLAL